jgi:AcrR family transcriptional regulator
LTEVKPAKSDKPYHHGDLAVALHDAAREILEEQGLDALSLRSVAKRAGVSHAAPYRHYASREALLADVALKGLSELQAEIAAAGVKPGDKGERIVHIGGAYLRFAVRHQGLLRLMFGSQLPNRADDPGLAEATAAIGVEIGRSLRDPAAGLTVWAAIHGFSMMLLDDVIDLGQRKTGLNAIPPRAEILLRSLVETLKE